MGEDFGEVAVEDEEDADSWGKVTGNIKIMINKLWLVHCVQDVAAQTCGCGN